MTGPDRTAPGAGAAGAGAAAAAEWLDATVAANLREAAPVLHWDYGPGRTACGMRLLGMYAHNVDSVTCRACLKVAWVKALRNRRRRAAARAWVRSMLDQRASARG